MEVSMSPAATALHESFVAAYGPYLDTALAARHLDAPPGWDDAVAAGRRWLDETLLALLRLPLDQQRRSPLELFQEAVRFPTEALDAADVPPVEREAAAQAALPGDRYDLAPASSQDLGAVAWRAHLAWGVAKAQDVAGAVPAERAPDQRPRRPTAVLVSSDLMDRSRVEPIVENAGLALETWRNPGAIAGGLDGPLPVVAFVDLTHPAADEAIREVSQAGVRTFAYGPHVDDVALVRARSLGANDAIARSRFFRRLPDLLPRLV